LRGRFESRPPEADQLKPRNPAAINAQVDGSGTGGRMIRLCPEPMITPSEKAIAVKGSPASK
jgi:hypothetical protein